MSHKFTIETGCLEESFPAVWRRFQDKLRELKRPVNSDARWILVVESWKEIGVEEIEILNGPSNDKFLCEFTVDHLETETLVRMLQCHSENQD